MDLPTRSDVAILGAGPAGLATTLALARLLPAAELVLIDGGPPGRPRGDELVGTALVDVLSEIGLDEDVLDILSENVLRPSRGVLQAWGAEGFRRIGAAGHRLDPAQLIACLRTAVELRGIRRISARLATVQTGRDCGKDDGKNDRVRLVIEAEGKQETLTTRFAVDASGRRSLLAQSLGACKIRFDRLVGLSTTFELAKRRPFDDVDRIVRAEEDGVWYAVPESSTRCVVFFLTDADIAHRLRLASGPAWCRSFAASGLGERLGEPPPKVSPTVHSLASHRLDKVDGDGWLAVGDAAWAADPLAERGLVRALSEVRPGATAVADALAGRAGRRWRYQHLVDGAVETFLDRQKEIYSVEERFPNALFWRRRQDSRVLTADRLVVARESPGAERSTDLAFYLSPEELRFLLSLCASPRLSGDVIRAFRRQIERPPSEQRILKALDHLIGAGLMSVE